MRVLVRVTFFKPGDWSRGWRDDRMCGDWSRGVDDGIRGRRDEG